MSKERFHLNVSDKYDFDIEDLDALKNEISTISTKKYHAITNNQSVEATIISEDIESKTIEVDIDGEVFQVKIKDSFDQLVKQMGLSASATKKLTDIKAPMPGLVLDIMVKEGDELGEGDGILILEAMKMENVIKAPGDLTIKHILVKKGEAVEKNQNLINIE